MQKLLLENGESFTSAAEIQIVRDIKEKHAFVAQNYAEEKEAATKSAEHDAQNYDRALIVALGCIMGPVLLGHASAPF